MALGVSGTTLLDELNRLANSGIYRVPSAMVDEARAAKQWATSLSINTNLTDTVGILNAIAGRTGNSRLDYNGVCNALAGTFQLPAAQALRSMPGEVVYAIGDIGPGGGFIFYDAGSRLSWGRYLECAPNKGWLVGGTPATDSYKAWSGNTNTLVGTTSAIGTGYANTLAIVAQSATADMAATVCRAYTGGGKTDWFLPSRNEVAQFISRAYAGQIGTYSSNGYYFSSTENNATTAWGRWPFGENAEPKSTLDYIRAIRYV